MPPVEPSTFTHVVGHMQRFAGENPQAGSLDFLVSPHGKAAGQQIWDASHAALHDQLHAPHGHANQSSAAAFIGQGQQVLKAMEVAYTTFGNSAHEALNSVKKTADSMKKTSESLQHFTKAFPWIMLGSIGLVTIGTYLAVRMAVGNANQRANAMLAAQLRASSSSN